ncbi:hypothetical protein B0A50_04429 [Salinomyces thailandicus]|uniref:PHD-type domain-containing protein n=1 Tax=Salinomyces thailandicus TaxID=706561 RepID=A0A4U0TYT5_9PEZI|nr:hypothetical protein B0A50_04429 [Salinomyces thailandica]
MPPKETGHGNTKITSFFKRFTVPKDRIPDNSAVDDEIVVASRIRHPASGRDAPSDHVQPPQTAPMMSQLSSQLSSLNSLSTSSPPGSPSHESDKTLRRRRTLQGSPTATPQKCSVLSSQDGTAKDVLLHSSPSSSRLRSVKAVEIPSPRPRASPSPVERHQQQQQQQPSAKPNTSFTSTSTLSTVPLSSQSSSRRMVRHGLPVVTNSESGSAEDSEELAELDSFMPRKKTKMTPPGVDDAPATRGSTAKSARKSARLSDRHSLSNEKDVPKLQLSPPRTVYKHSLANMVKERAKQKKADARIAEAEAAAAADNERRETARAAQVLDGKAMASDLAQDSDEGSRVVQAMVRTEALENEEKLFYFKQGIPSDTRFPIDALPEAQSWASLFKDEQSRTQFCLSGFAAELAGMGLFNPLITLWFAQQVAREPSDELREAYVNIVRASCAQKLMNDTGILSSFEGVYATINHAILDDAGNSVTSGADVRMSGMQLSNSYMMKCLCEYQENEDTVVACDSCGTWQHTTCYYPERHGRELPSGFEHKCTDCEPRTLGVAAAKRRQKRNAELEGSPSSAIQKAKQSDRAPGLSYFVQALVCCAPLGGVEGICSALTDLSLANIDEHVKRNTALRFAIQDAVVALCDRATLIDLDRIYEHLKCSLITSDVLSRGLKCRVVASLPATSARIHYIRRRLALYLATMTDSNLPLTAENWTIKLLNRIRKRPEFQVSDASDYAFLSAMVEILDIAIDCGFSDFAFLNQPQATPTSVFSRPAGPSLEEQAFNSQIDKLCQSLQLMMSRIKDAGATHLRRTEAKAAIERVVGRLEHTVRTRPKPKKGIFDSKELEESKGLMNGFLKKGEEQQKGVSVKAVRWDESTCVAPMSETADAKEDEGGSKDAQEVAPSATLSHHEVPARGDAISGAEAARQGTEELHMPETKGLWDFEGDVRV